MKKKIQQGNFSNDKLLTDEVLTIAAELVEQQIRDDIREHENRDVEIPEKLNRKLLETARKLDSARKADEKKHRWKSMNRIVAAFLICLVSLGSITMVTSDALRFKVFNLFSNDKTGSVTFRDSEETEEISSWKNFWYPTYLPEDFELVISAEEEHFLLYVNEQDQSEISVCEIDSGATLAFDNETSRQQKIKVGQYEGYVFSSNNTDKKGAVWLMDEKTIMMEFINLQDNDIVLKVINNMKYIN
ncbi:DUF4367 domain-containing protein [Anaerovoracaceae bacterium 42-11]